jgi:hypothetical protein
MNLETAVELLYTDESLTADVDDRTAKPLLKWAESVLPVLLARGEDSFDQSFVTFRKMIKSVARLIDLRGELDLNERAERAAKIEAFAQELGIPVNIAHLETLAHFDGPDLVAQMVGGAPQPHVAPGLSTAQAAPRDDGVGAQGDPDPLAGTTAHIEPSRTAPDGHTPDAENTLQSSIGDFFRRIAESLDADPETPDSKE